jgi:hypothetical protein
MSEEAKSTGRTSSEREGSIKKTKRRKKHIHTVKYKGKVYRYEYAGKPTRLANR